MLDQRDGDPKCLSIVWREPLRLGNQCGNCALFAMPKASRALAYCDDQVQHPLLPQQHAQPPEAQSGCRSVSLTQSHVSRYSRVAHSNQMTNGSRRSHKSRAHGVYTELSGNGDSLWKPSCAGYVTNLCLTNWRWLPQDVACSLR